MAVRLRDIAEATGLSPAAVSMALNGKPGVSEATRLTVQAAADRLGYRPNPSGKALRLSRTGSIGIYTPASLHDYSLYYGEITRGVVAGLADSGYSPVMLPSISDSGDLRELPAVDGYILVEPHADDLGVAAILETDAATVSIDPPPPGTQEPWGVVESDTSTSTAQSLDLMRERGSARPGVLVVETESQWTMSVLRRYDSWCAEHDISPLVLHVDLTQGNDKLRAQLAEIIDAEGAACDGLFICGDSVAARIAGVLRGLGHAIGDSVNLVSGVDSTIMEYHTPPITSVDMNPVQFGRHAAEMMRTLLKSNTRPQQQLNDVLAAPLVVRAT
ncbi:LacI family DNA-binding transcriptional regulator [Leucobacter aridicollis]|uniref:LacI family DNA-binding transcriptional regulator n=1 Tax=Leucobacter aridicollis TaxID=283878 RepID=UPI002167B357|nr:LacI family DNA-binding transcriptional regulator [Leucobacter aridicollis]MCS3426667.1 DNA-binding LacI/PurR family transcriptional regulator [Leucobacter aridicollis]